MGECGLLSWTGAKLELAVGRPQVSDTGRGPSPGEPSE